MNCRTLLRYLCTALFISASNIAFAQVYPVQATVLIQPPYSPYLTDYTSPGSQRLTLQLRANDITISDHPIKLRLTIEGLGITIRTKQNFIPQQLILSGGGIPTILYGEDLLEYLNPNNLDFAGLSRTEFLKTGKLPEGVYRFSIEVFSYNRNVQLSNRATTTAWIILNDPPLLNLPRKDAKIKILDPTNIAFTWTPRHTGSPNAAFSTEYIFRLVEIWPENRNPNDAFLSQPALYEETLTQTQLVYGMQHPALLPGRKYAWSVQAHDVDGRDLFKNQGKSEVFVFQFGEALSPPQNIKQDVNNATTISLSWEPPIQGVTPQQYRIRYRKKGTNTPWYESLTDQRWVTLISLQSNTTYEIQLRSEAKPQVSEYSTLQYVQTKDKSTQSNTCGNISATPPPDFTSPLLLMLRVGDVISANKFKVVLTEVTGQNGTFTGKGMMVVPSFNSASVKVAFSGIQVNNKYELVAGDILTTYTPGSKIGRIVEEAHKIGEEKPEQTPGNADETAAITYTVSGVIDSIYFDAEKDEIVVVDKEGNTNTYKQPIDAQSKEPMPVIITDSGRNSYEVDKDGNITKASASGSTASMSNSTVSDDAVKDRIIVLILEQFEEEIAAWLRINGKGGEDDPDVKLASALPECFPQEADVLESINTNTIPFYKKKENIHELRQKVEANAESNEIFNKVTGLFTSADSVTWNKVPEEDQELSRTKLCEIILEEDEGRNALLFVNPVSWTELAGGCETCPTGWEDLISFKPSKSTWDEIMRRREQAVFNGPYNRWDILDIEKAKGSKINLDYYSVKISMLPTVNKIQLTEESFFNYVRLNLDSFLDHSIASFYEFSNADKMIWLSNNPLTAVMKFHIPIGILFDDASVMCTNFETTSWVFSTIQNPGDNQHPVSGNRQFGLRKVDNAIEFYVRGADRLTGVMDQAIGETAAFEGADKLWKSFQIKLMNFINSHGGNSKIDESKYKWARYKW